MTEPIVPKPAPEQPRSPQGELPVLKNMLAKGPETFALPGERAGLREPNPKNPAEIQRFMTIENGPAMNEVNETPEDAITLDEMPGWLESLAARPHVTMKVITADAGEHPTPEHAVQGWLRIAQGTPVEGQDISMERERYQRISGTQMGENELDPCEITLAPMPDGPAGLMSSALFTGVSLIQERDRSVPGEHPPRTVLVFQEPPTPETQESFDALAACGFEQKTGDLVRYDPEDGGDPDTHMYVLNWQRFEQIAQLKKAALENKEEAAGREGIDAARQRIKRITQDSK